MYDGRLATAKFVAFRVATNTDVGLLENAGIGATNAARVAVVAGRAATNPPSMPA